MCDRPGARLSESPASSGGTTPVTPEILLRMRATRPEALGGSGTTLGGSLPRVEPDPRDRSGTLAAVADANGGIPSSSETPHSRYASSPAEQSRGLSVTGQPGPQQTVARSVQRNASNGVSGGVAKPASSKAGPPIPASRRVATSIEMTSDLRDRLRATFRATRELESEDTLRQMFEKLIEDECARREDLYNNGLAFVGGERNLPRGRPLGG